MLTTASAQPSDRSLSINIYSPFPYLLLLLLLSILLYVIILIGIIAKFIATIITFPLLKAKVLMMTNSNMEDLMKTLTAAGGDVALTSDNDHTNANTEASGGMSTNNGGASLRGVFPSANNDTTAADNTTSHGNRNNSDAKEVGREAKLGFLARYTTFSDLLRTSGNLSKADREEDVDDIEEHGVLNAAAEYISNTDLGRLLNTLILVLRMQGLGGLYTGIVVHLFHTTLRGAVSMSLKERFVMLLRKVMDRR